MGYWKLVDAADGWDTHKDKYEWVEEVEEKNSWGNKTGRTIDKPTGQYSYRRPWYERKKSDW